MQALSRRISDYAKNLRGWRAQGQRIAFAVDDYAAVRVASASAWNELRDSGLDVSRPMDRLDAVETREDLEALYEVLGSVADSGGRPAVFTAYVLSANPDFDAILQQGERYQYECVDRTFARLAAEHPQAYDGAWSIWRQGIEACLIRPQFHGREHYNIELVECKLRRRSRDLLTNLENRSMAGLSKEPTLPGVGFTEAFGLSGSAALPRHREILTEGLDLFERVWGFRSETFTPPAMKLHPSLFEVAERGGVRSIDKPLRFRRDLGDGQGRKEFNRSGRRRGQNHVTVVRNVVFEPCREMGFEPVSRALQQIAAAFYWRRPAIISSHRVNFAGHLDENNRKRGLDALQRLLKAIVKRWPEAEFVSVDSLVREMDGQAAP